MDELIRKKDALDALMAERKHLLANGQKGAEHVLTHHGYNVIDELPPVQSDVPDIYAGELISRQAAIDAIVNTVSEIGLHDNSEVARYGATFRQHEIIDIIKGMPPAQPKRGKWIHHEGGYSDHYECTACGKAIVLTGRWKFCPNCGADMRCSENPNS